MFSAALIFIEMEQMSCARQPLDSQWHFLGLLMKKNLASVCNTKQAVSLLARIRTHVLKVLKTGCPSVQ